MNVFVLLVCNHWTEEQTTKVIQDWNKTVAEINVLSKDAEIKQIDLDKHQSLVDAIIQHYVSGANKSDAEQSIREQLPIILKKLSLKADVLSVDADIAKDYKETMTKVGVVGDVIKIIRRLPKSLVSRLSRMVRGEPLVAPLYIRALLARSEKVLILNVSIPFKISVRRKKATSIIK